MFALNDEEKKALLFFAAILIVGCCVQYCRQRFVCVRQLAALQESLGKVNLNTADRRLLTSLPGIGNVLAQRILEYRMANDGFASVEDLGNIRGMSKARIDKIRSQVCVE